MKQRLAITLISFFALVILLSSMGCRRVQCKDPGIMVYIYGYDSTELAGIIKRTYLPGSNFTLPVFTDTLTGERISTTMKLYGSDTKKGFPVFGGVYDCVLELPAVGATHTVTDIDFDEDSYNEYLAMGEANPCSNSGSYKVDGVPYSFDMEKNCNGNCTVAIRINRK